MIEITAKAAEYVAIFALCFILAMQLGGMSLEANVHKSYTDFYSHLAYLGMIGLIGPIIFGMWFLSRNPLGLSLPWKLAIIGGFTAIILSMSLGGQQIWPVPKAAQAPLQLTRQTELYTSSVPPGFLEDLVYLLEFPTTLGVLWFLLRENALGGEIGATEFIATGVVACLIASTGYNVWVIPGFTSAHVPAYGGAQLAYAGAWIFSFGQSLVYFVTCVFLPVAHIMHNLIIAYGHVYMVAFVPLVLPAGGRVFRFIMANKFLVFGGLVLVLLVSGCLTPGQYLDAGISGAVNLTGNVMNWTAEAVRG